MRIVQEIIEQGFVLDNEYHGGNNLPDIVEGIVNSYVAGKDEPCVFYNEYNQVRVVVFVDDIIVRGEKSEVELLFRAIEHKYPMREWNILTPNNPLTHLGYRITEEHKGDEVYRYMDQELDVHKMLENHNIDITGKVQCPMPNSNSIMNNETELDYERASEYRSLVGSLSWYGIRLRWDIAHSVSRCQSVLQHPTIGAMNNAVRIASYLGATADFRLGGRIVRGNNIITCHSDSDHAGDRALGSRSHSGAMILMNGIAIHWRSKKQPKTAVSPAAAEIYACSEAVRELRWIWWMARDMGISISNNMAVQVDNKQVISFKYGTVGKSKLRGMISNRWNWVIELKSEGINIEKVASKKNMADILTKCLDRGEFIRQVNQIKEFANEFGGQSWNIGG